MTARCNTTLNAQVYQLGWMTAIFVPTKRWFGAWERSLSQGPFKGLGLVCWCANVKEHVHTCDSTMSSPIGGSIRFFSNKRQLFVRCPLLRFGGSC